jgi:membrane-associated phospholipid phosphatase
MHTKNAVFVLVVLSGLGATSAQAQAQEPKIDSATIARANKPILRRGELIGVLATTGIAMAFDKKVLNTIHDPHDSFGRSVSDFGNALGNGVYVYPTLLVASIAGKAIGSRAVYGVASRALKSTLLAGVSAFALKFLVGRERPPVSDNAFKFHPINFKDSTNSFPSGHATVAFALATSFAREIKGTWDDVLFYTMATTTAYARMHDNRHWLSDVVFGAGVGILSTRFIHRREAKLLVGKSVLGASLEF